MESVGISMDFSFLKNKRVFVTGHTGFKGAWLSRILLMAGAEVTGYALKADTSPNLYSLLNLENKMHSVIGDIRDFDSLYKAMREARPDFVLHLAAQPIVRASYEEPLATYQTNVMGTVHVLEAIRRLSCVKSFLNVTTDKVYENKEWEWGYRENEFLDGFDPYSNSKSCSELVTHSYNNSFFKNQKDKRTAVSTARAGNVIGGGDFARDRIVPDCVRAALAGEEIRVRNPYSVRPYQHVLESLSAYLLILKNQCEDTKYADSYNVGPGEGDCISTGELVGIFCALWGEGQSYHIQGEQGPHEANFLKLDSSKIRSRLGWKPVWSVRQAIEKTVDWTRAYQRGEDMDTFTQRQIEEYFSDLK